MLRGLFISFTIACVAIPSATFAGHVPNNIDVDRLWTPLPDDGYLNFMTPSAFIPLMPDPNAPGNPIPPGGIYTEEHTGWSDAKGMDHVDPLGPPVWPNGPDNDPFAGDRADFDWVQEHRPHETAMPPISNHPGSGAMGWNIAPTMASPHTTNGVPHGHSQAENPPGVLPELSNNDYMYDHFYYADVFSIISEGEDSDMDDAGHFSRRDAALDYDLWFVNLNTGISTPGIPILVFTPGWTNLTSIDDFVARWVPATPGFWNAVAIDPPTGMGHDQICEIDAVKVAIPEPMTLALFAVGAAMLFRKRK